MTKDEEINKRLDYIENRFKGARFCVSCFKNIEEIETKILAKTNTIICRDSYILGGQTKQDYFIVSSDKPYVTYADVVDELIRCNFVRNDCDHRYLEGIGKISTNKRRNKKSIPLFGFGWGS